MQQQSKSQQENEPLQQHLEAAESDVQNQAKLPQQQLLAKQQVIDKPQVSDRQLQQDLQVERKNRKLLQTQIQLLEDQVGCFTLRTHELAVSNQELAVSNQEGKKLLKMQQQKIEALEMRKISVELQLATMKASLKASGVHSIASCFSCRVQAVGHHWTALH